MYYGMVLGYRRGPNTQYPGQVVVSVLADRKVVYSLVGSKVKVKDKYNNTYIGRVVRVVGSRNPKVLVTFNKNIPGQLIGKQVIIERSPQRTQ